MSLIYTGYKIDPYWIGKKVLPKPKVILAQAKIFNFFLLRDGKILYYRACHWKIGHWKHQNYGKYASCFASLEKPPKSVNGRLAWYILDTYLIHTRPGKRLSQSKGYTTPSLRGLAYPAVWKSKLVAQYGPYLS